MSNISLKKNYLFSLSYQILNLITPLITAPYVARVLGPDGVGIYSYTASIMMYFTMFGALGTMNYGTREIARLRDDKKQMSNAFWGIVAITCLSSFICLLGWFVLIIESSTYKYYFWALTPLIFATMADISWFYTGIEKVSYTVIRNTICKIIGIVLLFVFVKEKQDLFLYMIMNSFIQLFGNLSMWSYLPKLINGVNFKELHLLRHLRETSSYFVITIAISLYTVLDKVLIGLITNDNYQNGYYEQATKIINIAKTVSFAALNSIMTARLSYLFENKKYDEIHSRISESLDCILLLVWGCIFGIIAVAKDFVPVFFGPGYEPVVFMLCLMSPLVFVISLSTCLGSHYYLPAGMINKSTRMTIYGSILNLIINLLLIPYFGAVGAIIGTLVGESFISFLYVYNAKDFMRFSLVFEKSYKRIVAGVIMVFGGIAFSKFISIDSFSLLFVQIIICACIYVLALICLKDKMFFKMAHVVLSKFKR